MFTFVALLITTASFGQASPGTGASENINQLIAIIAMEQRSLSTLARSRKMATGPGPEAVGALISLGQKAVDPVAELLKSDKPIVRTNAAWILSAMRLPAAEAKLYTALGDSDPQVRLAAVCGLRTLASVETRKALWRMLKDEHEDVCAAAVRQLAFPSDKPPTHAEISNYQRNEMIDALKPLLRDKSLGVRQAVAATLSSYRNSNAIDSLKVLLSDADHYVRGESAEGLGGTGSRRVVESLIRVLQDENGRVAGRAAIALGELGDPRATLPLVGQLHATDDSKRYGAAVALGKIGDLRAVEPLIAALDDSEENVRRAVATSLGQLRDARAVQPLIGALDPKRREVADILRALGELNDARAIRPIAEALFADSEHAGSITDAVADAAVKIKHPALVRELAERAVANPKHDSVFISRRIIGRLTGEDFAFDHDGFVRWWERSKSQFSE